MAKIVVSFKKPSIKKRSRAILVRENRESRESREEVQVQQIDEIWGGAGHAYKWLGPLHDILNMTDPADKGLFQGVLEWYQTNKTTQTVMGALAAFEEQMNKAWESGAGAKAKALTIQSALTGFEPIGTGVSTSLGYLLRQQRDDMEKEKLEMAKKAAAAIEVAKEEAEKTSQGAMAIAENPKLKAIIKQLQADIRQKEFEKAKQMFTAAAEIKKAVEPSELTRASQETMYQPTNQPVNETKGKKMTKKYSSFKQQQMITENFRRFISEIRVEDQIGEPGDLVLTGEKVANTRGLSGDEGKGYASMIKQSSKYPLDSIKQQAADPMAPQAWKDGAELAITDIEEWLKSGEEQSLMNWVMTNK